MIPNTSPAAGLRLVNTKAKQIGATAATAAELRYRRRALLANRANLSDSDTGAVMLDPPVTLQVPAAALLAAIDAELLKVEDALGAIGEAL